MEAKAARAKEDAAGDVESGGGGGGGATDQKKKRGRRASLATLFGGHGGRSASKSRAGSTSTVIDLEQKVFRIEFSFVDMGLKLKKGGKKVLASVSGSLRHSCLTAIMGPSGAGKTTFLNTISGKAYYGDRTGELLINGRRDKLTKYAMVTGFVPQDDIMLKEMTVKEIPGDCETHRT